MEILLVEDNYPDVRWMQMVLAETGLPHVLTVLGDGADALAFLDRVGSFRDAPRPALVLLDINLPKVDGITVLRHIRNRPEFDSMHVAVVTGSAEERRAVVDEFGLDESCYLTKPVSKEAIEQLTTMRCRSAAI
jgi:CheY-like chemotaxis protein